MRRLNLISIFAIALFLIGIACSDRSMMNSVTNSETQPELAGDASGGIVTFYLTAVDWDGISPIQPNTFYRVINIDLAREHFSGDEVLLDWLNSLPNLDKTYAQRSASSSDGEQIIQVTVIKTSPEETTGPLLAALGWSANATITPLSGGSVARCQTTTTNPSGVSGYKSHQIWVFNQNGWVYFADYWATLDLLEHTVNFTHDRSVACDSTVRCLGRIVKDGVVMAYDVDTYVRSCN